MSILRLNTTLLLSFLAAQALSLPHHDPRYLSGHDVRASELQSTTPTTTTILTMLSGVMTIVNVEYGAAKTDHQNPTVGMSAPELKGFRHKCRARRRKGSDSHNTLTPTEEVETASHSPESGRGQDDNPDTAHLSRSTKSPISTSNSPVSTDATGNQEEAELIKRAGRAKLLSRCAPQDYECLGLPYGVAVGSGEVQEVQGDRVVTKPKDQGPPPKEYVETPPPTGHK